MKNIIFRDIPIDYDPYEIMKSLDNSLQTVASLRHPHIVGLHNLFWNEEQVFLVMELCEGGSLYDLLETTGALPENQAADFMVQLLSAVQYLHENKAVHRDIKLENVLLNQTWDRVKLADFETSRFIPLDRDLITICGSPGYAAPEIFEFQGYDQKCDIWSLGVICYELLYGGCPFEDEIITKNTKIIFPVDYQTSPAWNFVTQLLQFNPAARPSAEEALRHPWLAQARSVKFSCKCHPSTRLSLQKS